MRQDPRQSGTHSAKAAKPFRLTKSDEALLELVQRQTFRYFWDFAHPHCGLARDRSDPKSQDKIDVVVSGGSGFGVMAIVVAVERGWITREQAVERLTTIIDFLFSIPCYHGVMPHMLNGNTGNVIHLGRKDDGGDLVETAFLVVGLLCARQYFNRDNAVESHLRQIINWFWEETEWDWHARDGGNVLYWHWSPNNGWAMNFELRGWNEALITYVLGASSPRYPINPDVYHKGWAEGRKFTNGRRYYDIELPLGPDYGGPMFFAHYSFLGLDPRGLKDRYADYWQQNVQHVRINREHCVRNPNGFAGYGEHAWGLTSCDGPDGYGAYAPDSDAGVIAPTAALSSMPYAPDHSLAALKHFHGTLGHQLWRDYGFVDGFCESRGWYADTHLAIDQGPIIIMIENYRTGLLWNLFMSCPEIQHGLRRLGFESPHLAAK
ncbi:glucoamylase family protein [Methylovirgula sp. 4M-Z18]|uniref:glucoamylase family protein n=1 Tax=Methylovirgula sp. 4M-Z18 TaxID=2293567 RepID=UPI0018F41B36|nr:glucoamylase family protein [Methylovirgula sp. 4M-Z18]